MSADPEERLFAVRRGGSEDAALVLGLFDSAVVWMVRRQATEQWGTRPFSEEPRRVAAVGSWSSQGGLFVCERDGRAVAALVLGDAPAYAPPAQEPERYVVALVSSCEPASRGSGRLLLRRAERESVAAGVGLLRLDCFAGNGGALVRYYVSAGFTPTTSFRVGAWPAQVLQKRLDPAVSGTERSL